MLLRLVCDERYEQHEYVDVRGVEWSPGLSYHETVRRRNLGTRRLRSDLITIATPDTASDGSPWVQLRDVHEVDGKPQPYEPHRALRLLARSGTLDSSAAKRIAEQSAQFNIGPVKRTLNFPLLPLLFVIRQNQWRFAYTLERFEEVGGRKAGVVQYREQAIPSLIRPAGNAYIAPVQGHVWIDSKQGYVLRATVRHGGSVEHTDLQVEYRVDAKLDAAVPVQMREDIDLGPNKPRLKGVAQYTNCRRFETQARIIQRD